MTPRRTATIVTTVLVVLAFAMPADAQSTRKPCVPAIHAGDLQAAAMIARPTEPKGLSLLLIETTDGKPLRDAKAVGTVGSTWTTAQVEMLAFVKLTNANAAMVWTTADGTSSCLQTYAVSGAPGPSSGVTGLPTGVRGRTFGGPDQCSAAGQLYAGEVASNDPSGSRRHTVMVFNDGLGLCYQNNPRPAQGALIHVAVFTASPDDWSEARVQFQPCSLQPSTPAILTTGSISDLPESMRTSKRYVLRAYTPRQCWNESVAITVQGKQQEIAFSLQQAARYRATLHLGAIFSESHEVTFGLRPEGGKNFVFPQGPTERGPEYVAALVFYGVPHYFSRRSYPGRDPVGETGVRDRIGAVIGVGLRNPLNRFVAGVSFELAAGVNVVAVREFVQTNQLAGIEDGAEFSGTAAQIPTSKVWLSPKVWTFGLTLDLVYATAAFKR